MSVITLTSRKGGVGKTLLAIVLAGCLTTAGTTDDFRVRAVNATGTSANPTEVSVLTVPAGPV